VVCARRFNRLARASVSHVLPALEAVASTSLLFGTDGHEHASRKMVFTVLRASVRVGRCIRAIAQELGYW
jgi:hypothetical protein